MKFERHHKWKTILFVLLRNALPLAFFLYGLKCIVMLHGKLTEPHDLSTPHMLGSFKIVSVTGTTAALTGLGYIAGGLFFICPSACHRMKAEHGFGESVAKSSAGEVLLQYLFSGMKRINYALAHENKTSGFHPD